MSSDSRARAIKPNSKNMDILQTVCRICESQQNLCDLTTQVNENVAEKLSTLTSIRISPEDSLPRCICLECIGSLNLAYDFLLRCEASEQRLRDALRGEAEPNQKVEIEEMGQEDEEEETATAVEFVVSKSDEEVDDDDMAIAIVQEETMSMVDDAQFLYETVPMKYTIEEYLEDGDDEDVDQGEEHAQTEVVVEEVEVHMPEEMSNEKDKHFYCDTCGSGFEKCTDLYQHIKSHGKARYQCKECDRWFSRRAHLQSHEVIHTGERNFHCHRCPSAYKSSRNLRRHVKSAHLGEKPFVCDLCGKEFSQKTVLEAHHSTHVQEKNYSCEVCPKRFKSSKLLKLHVIRHVKGSQPKQETEPVECDVCHKVYSSKMSLKNHKLIHSDAKIACTFCGKNFKIMAHLKVHLRSHTKEQPYECNQCHKKFGYETSLKTHRLVHSNERPYKCDLCDVAFRQLNHLKAHKFLHSGQKPFECTVCKKAFALRGNLTIHMRIHDGPVGSPFQCRLCVGKRLNDSNALKRHLRAHPNAKVVKTGTLTVIVEEGTLEETETGDLAEDGRVKEEISIADSFLEGDS
ncbi:gastrula zinc finger protein XlCGF57.1-like [Armigeres subalbatus]|uniref:gastrula zinc finger protein XlCGF57.1-like n=1 Tax=Armigeres subalbatus TaxID=124917 RepID=UPI002ED313C8